jgi:phage RecT family recombinase
MSAQELAVFQKELGTQLTALKSVLPASVTPEKFLRIAMTAISGNPRLLEGNRQVLFAELVKCASDGLVPDGREAAIVPFKGTGKYMPMVGGICKRARNSGAIKGIDAQVVYDNDSYESWIDETGPHFKHVKARKDRGEIVLTYAYAIGTDGELYHEEILESDMEKIRNTSKAGDSPWNGPFKDEMRRKSAIRRLAKYRLPSSAELDDLIRRDDDLHDLMEANRSHSSTKTEDQIKQEVADSKKKVEMRVMERSSLVDSLKVSIDEKVRNLKTIGEKVEWMKNNLGISGVNNLGMMGDSALMEMVAKLETLPSVELEPAEPVRVPTEQEKEIAKLRQGMK